MCEDGRENEHTDTNITAPAQAAMRELIFYYSHRYWREIKRNVTLEKEKKRKEKQ